MSMPRCSFARAGALVRTDCAGTLVGSVLSELFPIVLKDVRLSGVKSSPEHEGSALMYVTLVYVHVKPEHIEEFVEATAANAEASLSEPGNVRFDMLRMSADPCRFVLYEAYATPEDATAHKATEHYVRWRETVADWMAAPREGVVYEG